MLTVIITSILLATYPCMLWGEYSKRKMAFFMMISLAAISLTLGGIITMVAIPGMFTVIYVIQTKKWKNNNSIDRM